MTIEDVAEMHAAASAAVGLFPRIEVDPVAAAELCDLAIEALRARAKRERDDMLIYGKGDRNRGVSAPAWACSCKRDPQHDAIATWDPLCELHGEAMP